MRTITEISDETYYKMEKFSQLILDIVSDVEDAFMGRDPDQTALGALHYKIENVIEVIDPKREDDKRILIELLNLTEDEQVVL